MRWLTITLLQLSAVYALANAVWEARWVILAAALAGGLAAVLAGAVLLRDGH
nr:hypothetical protein [Actinomycetota bacterium]